MFLKVISFMRKMQVTIFAAAFSEKLIVCQSTSMNADILRSKTTTVSLLFAKLVSLLRPGYELSDQNYFEFDDTKLAFDPSLEVDEAQPTLTLEDLFELFTLF